jgi:tRNA-Thr(GGU) m(6)t(6)A37 methyltransferase TsaA
MSNLMEINLKPVGIIHTQIYEKKDTPIQSSRSEIPGTVEIFSQFSEGLDGVEEFSHIILLYIFHRLEQPANLRVQPFLDDKKHGIFATRFPARPNPIGFSVVHVIKVEGNLIYFQGADMWDGTLLLDIKPYVPDFDIHPASRIGWYEKRAYP